MGRCDLTVGPHTFANISFFEIHWSTDPSAAAAPATPTEGGLPPLSQSLMTRLNSEAAKDKLLADIIQRVSSKQAKKQEVSALNRYIVALRASMLSTPRAHSLVVEFEENPNERFILPFAIASAPSPNGLQLSFHLQPSSAADVAPPPSLIVLQLHEPPDSLAQSLANLANKPLPDLPRIPRVYLQLQSVDKSVTAKKIVPPSATSTLTVSAKPKVTKIKPAKNAPGKKKSAPSTKAKTSTTGKSRGRPRKDGQPAQPRNKGKGKSKEIVDDEGEGVVGEPEVEVEGEGEELLAAIKGKPTKRQSLKNAGSARPSAGDTVGGDGEQG